MRKKKIKLSCNRIAPAVETYLDLREEGKMCDKGETDTSLFFVSHSRQSTDNEGLNRANGLVDVLPGSFPPKKAWESSNDCHLSLPLRAHASSGSTVEQGVAVSHSLPLTVPLREEDKRECSTSPPPYSLACSLLQDGAHSLENTEGVGSSTEELNSWDKKNTHQIYQLPLDGLSSQQKYGVAMSSPQSDNSSSFKEDGDSVADEDHFRSLQEASAATVVAVSPAPKEQRTTFEAHKQSKLSSAEAGGNVYDFDFSLRGSEKAAGSESLSIPCNTYTGSGGEELHRNIPYADIKLVLPQKNGAEQRVSTSTRRNSPEPVVSGSHAETGREDEATWDDGEPTHKGKEMEKSSEQSLTRLDDESSKGKEILTTVKGAGTVSAKRNPEAKEVDPNRKRKKQSKKKKLSGIEMKPVEENCPVTTQEGSFSVSGINDGKMSSVLPEVSTSSYSQSVKTIRSTTMSRVSDIKIRALKAIDLPPLKEVEHTDIYLGKCLYNVMND